MHENCEYLIPIAAEESDLSPQSSPPSQVCTPTSSSRRTTKRRSTDSIPDCVEVHYLSHEGLGFDSNCLYDDGGSTSDEDDSSTASSSMERRRPSYRWTVLVGVTMVAIALTVWKGLTEENLRRLQQQAASSSNMLPLMSSLPEQLTAPQAYLLGLLDAQMSYIMNDTWMTRQKERLRPGYTLAQQGARAKYPIVMIPGFVTSSLELWDGLPCAKTKYFRQRLWGGFGPTTRSFLTDFECYTRHMELDLKTGLDPEGIKLRATDSFDGADYFMSGYWVWNKMIQNFADVGYDASTMTMETYDWRLSFPMLEKRDGYMTKLKMKIEAIHKTTGKKVALVSHSMGSQLLHYFFSWVTTPERKGGGGGGKRWVDEHVQVFVNIAGPMLGTAKAVPSLLSGEFKDTASLDNAFGGAMVEQFWGRVSRKRMWDSWGSLWTLLPMGGDLIWGDEDDEPFLELTDAPTTTQSVMTNDSNKESCEENDSVSPSSATTTDVVDDDSVQDKLIQEFSKSRHQTLESTLQLLSQLGKERGIASATTLSLDPTDIRSHPGNWHDPTRTPLPYAPNMKIFCFYGHGIDTERSYKYKRNVIEAEATTAAAAAIGGGFGSSNDDDDANTQSFSATTTPNNELPFIMDSTMEDTIQNIQYGAKLDDGDASVSLVSLGYVCADGWRRQQNDEQNPMNPSNIPIVTREYKHQEEFVVDDPIRGGPQSADHVDILGNTEMTKDLLRVVTDFYDDDDESSSSSLQDKYTSNIMEIVQTIKERKKKRQQRGRSSLSYSTSSKNGGALQYMRDALSSPAVSIKSST